MKRTIIAVLLLMVCIINTASACPHPPVTIAKYDYGTLAPNQEVTFTAVDTWWWGTSAPAQWSWDFNYHGTFNPTIITYDPSASYIYTSAGTYTVAVQCMNDAGQLGNIYTFQVVINPVVSYPIDQPNVISSSCNYFSNSKNATFSSIDPNFTEATTFPNGNYVKNYSFEQNNGSWQPSDWGIGAQVSMVYDSYLGSQAVEIFQQNGQWAGISQSLGIFKAGHTYTASVWFKASTSVHGQIFFGDDGGADPYDNCISTSVLGNGSWQRISVTHTMTHDDMMSVYIYGLDNSGVIYDGVIVEETSQPSQAMVSKTYTDGLGRTLQTQQRNGTNDVLAAVGYDVAGRQAYTYNPYSSSTTNHQYDPNYATTSAGYSQVQYYPDPLSRPQWNIPIGATSQNQYVQYAYGSAALDGTQSGTLYNYTDVMQKPSTANTNWVTSRQYADKLGRVVKSCVLDGSTVIQSSTTLFNMNGQPVQTTDPKGLQSSCTYDFLGNMILQTTPDGGTTKYVYDQAGRLRFMADANGLAATPYNNILYWKYDLFGRVVEKGYINTMNWGDGSALQTYANTNPAWPATPNTWRKKFTYDAGGSVSYMNGQLYKAEVNNDNDGITDVQETYAYDKDGNVLTHNLNAFHYDGMTYTTSYTYDQLGRVTNVSYPESWEDGSYSVNVAYTYNVIGQVSTVGNASNSAYYARYTYNPDGSINTEQFNAPGLDPRIYSYDIQGKLLSISNSKFNEILTYESGGVGGTGYYNGNVASSSISYGSGSQATPYSTQYLYDDMGQLTAANLNYSDQNLNPFSTYSASYYSNGTFNQRTTGSTTKTYMYYPNTNRVMNTSGSSSTTDYGYDANGNIVKSNPKSIPTIVYDPFTNMTTSVIASGGTRTETYSYTADNERVLKNDISAWNTNTTLYLRGGNSFVLTEKFNYQGNISNKNYIYGPTGLIAMVSASNTYYIMKDHLGSTHALVNQTNGTAGSTYDYAPLGGMMRSTIAGSDIKYGFTGQEYETETTLHNFHERMYDADLGLFYGCDPKGEFFNSYCYAGNTPTAFIDPTGEGIIIPGDDEDDTGDEFNWFDSINWNIISDIEQQYPYQSTDVGTNQYQNQSFIVSPDDIAPINPLPQGNISDAMNLFPASTAIPDATTVNNGAPVTQGTLPSLSTGSETMINGVTWQYQGDGDCRVSSSEMCGYNSDRGVCTVIDMIDKDFNHGLRKSNTYNAGITLLNNSLKKGVPVVVGVNYYSNKSSNQNKASDHYIAIVRHEIDANGRPYYRFYDPGVSSPERGKSPLNRIYFNATTGLWQGKCLIHNKPTYTLTEVRIKR